jgi:hypothetical protein
MKPCFRATKLTWVLVLSAACGGPIDPGELPSPDLSYVRFPDCEGPATSLDPALAAALPKTSWMIPDDEWARLAKTTPGGFAGVFYDAGKPVIMLTDPTQALAAKEAVAQSLASMFLNFDLHKAEVRQARWDFAKLVDWFNYVSPTVWRTPGSTMGDKDEVLNRVNFGMADSAGIPRLMDALSALALPCDLIAIQVVPPIPWPP